MKRASVRVIVADDQAPFRQAARTVVAATPGFTLVGEATSGEDAVRLVGSLAPDLVLLDVVMPGIGGIEAARRIAAAHPRTTTILLSSYPLAALPDEAQSCGAATYIHKEDFAPEA